MLGLALAGFAACEGDGGDDEQTPEQAQAALVACGLPQPCAAVDLAGECCDEPSTEPLSADEICVFETLRDRTSAQLTLIYEHDPDEWDNGYIKEDLFIWGSGEATFARATLFNGIEGSGLAMPQAAELEPAAYFDNCLQTADLGELAACRSVKNWYASSQELDIGECQ